MGNGCSPWLSLVMSLLVSYFLCYRFSLEMSWMRSRPELSQFLRIFPTFSLFHPLFHFYRSMPFCMSVPLSETAEGMTLVTIWNII